MGMEEIKNPDKKEVSKTEKKEPEIVGAVHCASFSDGRIDIKVLGSLEMQNMLITILSESIKRAIWNAVMKTAPSIIKPNGE